MFFVDSSVFMLSDNFGILVSNTLIWSIKFINKHPFAKKFLNSLKTFNILTDILAVFVPIGQERLH